MSVELVPLPEAFRKNLHHLALGLFLDGECYAFAIALQRGLGWPMIGLMDGEVIRHAGVISPQGTYFDVRGENTSFEEFAKPFGLEGSVVIKEITYEEDIRPCHPVNIYSINSATWMIEAIWPNLSGWNQSGFNSRAVAFLQEVEGLSRKHGVFIRSASPGSKPILCEAVGDEEGYTYTPTINGPDLIFDRKLRGPQPV